MSTPAILEKYPAATFTRCLGAILYDAFLIAAIQMLVLLIIGNVPKFAFDMDLPDFVRLIICFLAGAYFYVWCWTHGGKTLGMTAWRIEVRQLDGRTITTKQAWVRAFTALLGLSNIGKLFHRHNMAIHDPISGTVVVLDKERTLKQD